VDVAHSGALQACSFRLAVAAFGTGALAIDPLVERAVTIQSHTHLSAQFPIEVLDTPFSLEKLRVVTALACRRRPEQRAAKALRAVAVGVGKREGGVHAPALGTQGDAIDIAPTLGMPMLVEGDGGDAPTMHDGLIDVPGIEGGISSDVSGKKAEGGHGADVEGNKVGDIAFVKRLGILGEDDIAVDGIGAGRDSRPIAEQTFLFFFRAAIGLLLVAALFDAEATIGIAFGDIGDIKGAFDVDARVVLAHPGVDMGHIEGHDLAESRDFCTQSLDGFIQQRLQHGLLEGALFLAQPASGRHGALHIKAVGLGDIEHWTKAQFEYEERMLHQEAAQAGTGGQALLQLEQQGLDIRMAGEAACLAERGQGAVRGRPARQTEPGTRDSVAQVGHAQADGSSVRD